jgi:hypothetical protein
MSHPEIYQILFEELILNEIENEGKCARNSLQLGVDDASLTSILWINTFCISESYRSSIPKLNLIPISISLLKMIQNIHVEDKNLFLMGVIYLSNFSFIQLFPLFLFSMAAI